MKTITAPLLIGFATLALYSAAVPAAPEEAAAAALKVWQKEWREKGGRTNVQDIFFSPTWESEKAWGEPAVNFHGGRYVMIYDYFATHLPFVAATSTDGVYWQDQGPVMEKDEDKADIECATIHRFQAKGPYVMQYAFRQPGASHLMRFAVSDDLLHWRKLGTESTFVPDPRWYQPTGRWDTILSWPKGDGTWYGTWNCVPCFGFGTTTDGIHWKVMPPVQGCAGLEAGGFFKLGDRYYIVYSAFGAINRDEHTAVSDRPEGPYRPTPKNHCRVEDPFIYARCYSLPGGIFSAEMLWVRRAGKRSYHFPLLKKVEREGESLWLKWWQTNERLKVHRLKLSSPVTNAQMEGCRRFDIPEKLDLSKGTVVEGTVRLPARSAVRKNLAMGVKEFKGEQPSQWQLDLRDVQSIGSIRVKGHAIRKLELSADGQAWKACSGGVNSGPTDVDVLSSGAPYAYYDDLSAKARYVRFISGAKGDVRICQESSESAGYADSGVGGLVLERSGATDYAVLIAPDGTVEFGTIGKDGKHFHSVHERNIDVDFGPETRFRLVLRADMGELYLNDYQISLMNLSGPALTGRIGFFGFDGECPSRDIKAWTSDPAVGKR